MVITNIKSDFAFFKNQIIKWVSFIAYYAFIVIGCSLIAFTISSIVGHYFMKIVGFEHFIPTDPKYHQLFSNHPNIFTNDHLNAILWVHDSGMGLVFIIFASLGIALVVIIILALNLYDYEPWVIEQNRIIEENLKKDIESLTDIGHGNNGNILTDIIFPRASLRRYFARLLTYLVVGTILCTIVSILVWHFGYFVITWLESNRYKLEELDEYIILPFIFGLSIMILVGLTIWGFYKCVVVDCYQDWNKHKQNVLSSIGHRQY